MARRELNISQNRSKGKYSYGEQTARVLWCLAYGLFRLSPKFMWEWRNIILRLFGSKIGSDVRISNSAKIWMPWNLDIDDWTAIGDEVWIYNLGKVTIGSKVTISHRAHLCAGTHDAEDSTIPLIKSPIKIGNQAWICSDAYIGPGAVIGEGGIAGARAVVMKSVDPWTVVVGNPARMIKKRELKY